MTGGAGPGGRRTPPRQDDTTWETWWMFNRFEFLEPRPVVPAVTPVPGVVGPMDVTAVRRQIWPLLLAGIDSHKAFVRTASMVTLGRVAAIDSGLAAEARPILLRAIHDRDRRVARAAIRGLTHIADANVVRVLHREAGNRDHAHDVRGFLTLAIPASNLGIEDGLLASLWKGDEGGNVEITTLAALGETRGGDGDRVLVQVALDRDMRPELRGAAVTALARRGGPLARRYLHDALEDRSVQVRRAAALGLGIMDWRTSADRELDGLQDVPLADVRERVEVLLRVARSQRAARDDEAGETVKHLARTLKRDRDRFTRSMAAISLGRIARQLQGDEGGAGVRRTAITLLERDLARDKHAQREFDLLALGIAGAESAIPSAMRSLTERGSAPTTRAAAAITLGMVGHEDGVPSLLSTLQKESNPLVRGYVGLALGMIGAPETAPILRAHLSTARAPEELGHAMLGLALHGKSHDTAAIVQRLGEGNNDVVGWSLVHALRCLTDRAAIPALLEVASARSSHVQELGLLGLGYVTWHDAWPARLRMSRGHDYTIRNLTLDAFYLTL